MPMLFLLPRTAIEELSASTEEIAASAQEMMNISKQLMEQMEKFKV